MTFYCLNIEFYDYGKINACITGRQTKDKPKNQFRRVYGMIAFKLWLINEQRAKELCEMIINGEVFIDDLISFYEECLPLEERAA